MKWFKHMSAARRDQKLRELRAEFGVEGYGAYWIILEDIAEQMGEKGETSLTASAREWSAALEFSAKKLENFLKFCQKINLFSVVFDGKLVTIKCPKLLKIKDEYTSKKARNSGQKSGQSPEQKQKQSKEVKGSVGTTVFTTVDVAPQQEADRPTDFLPDEFSKQVMQAYREWMPGGKPISKSTPRLLELIAKRRRSGGLGSIELWREFFLFVSESRFLSGKKSINGQPFIPSLEFLIGDAHFEHVCDRKYHDAEDIRRFEAAIKTGGQANV